MAKLYLLTQNVNSGYDTFDSCIVVAENEEEAKNIRPSSWADSSCWAEPKDIEAEEIGEAKEGLIGCILASFNAG